MEEDDDMIFIRSNDISIIIVGDDEQENQAKSTYGCPIK